MTGRNEEAEELKAQLTQTERRLKEIAERYVLATAAAHVGVWDWNLETGDFYLDPNIKGFLGYQDHEIPNDLEIWAQYIHPDDKEGVMKAAQDVIDGRVAEYAYEHRMKHKDGSVRWFMVRGKVIRDRQNRPLRFVGTDTDITRRRLLEQQIRELSNEIETRIGHDLHDSLGQELAGLALKLHNAERRLLEENSSSTEAISEARALAERAMQTTSALAQGLSPVLSEFGLARTLAQLADNAQRIYDIECGVDLPDPLPDHFSGALANELYRITQEAITNAVRHGQATRVMIEGRIVGQRFLLNIVDNGKGFVAPDPDSPSMGLRIMQYRARHLGATLTLSRRRAGGTLVVCSCPIPA